MKESLRKRNRGITLIALVITIIILLILAAVTIAALSGDNGILRNAARAKQETERQDVIEQAKLDILGKQADNTTVELERKDIKDVLDTYFKEVPDNFTSDTVLTTKEEYGNYEITVSEIYNEILKEEETVLTASDIANIADKTEIYGAEVRNYTTADDSKAHADGWKIFYAGTVGEETTPHIYLIASDYIEYQYIPYSTNNGSVTTNKPNQGSSSYSRAAYFTNILGNYTGSASITDGRIQSLNYSYFSQGFTSANNNMKAVAYMLDADAWKDFAGEKAEYAIAGPTVELLFKSYNEKYGTEYVAEVTNILGYQIKKQESDSWSSFIENMLDANDNLYVINTPVNAEGMWMSSPINFINGGIANVINDGLVCGFGVSADTLGFRPLVCLESNVELQKNTDESGVVYYMIRE